MHLKKLALIFSFACLLLQQGIAQKKTKERGVWTAKQANAWYKKQPWLVGPNFLPSTAINQLEMWQEDTFDTVSIDKELGLAESIGMNTARVFLHDQLHQQDSIGLYLRINKFLEIAQRHKIKPLLVFFDSCWDPFPKAGTQREPKPFVHNSGWVQSPGQVALKDSSSYPRLEAYIKGVIRKFATDKRILGWDVWNEPDNMTGPSYEKIELPNKVDFVLPLLRKTFIWARSVNPSQPLTSGIWAGNWSSDQTLKPIEKLQVEQSDIISFHNYDKPEQFEMKINQLQRYNKPLLCTEYMARPNGSTFEGFLPLAKKHNVAMFNWGFVSGKSQTIYPWDSWTKTYTSEPPLWFHDIFHTDGTPYKQEETSFISTITKGATKGKK
ncbi:cellulase family glycosylhydrolase [Desertivirga arenae]|uniref:cellulase family glycosylhydrolase n=1 Tax=Desertivirga arenae TaxID=2810309 RepID=UPI001A967F8A|nr:cellulase family glycosylhydrolase [Pedobacter sp. SYSU D00823]